MARQIDDRGDREAGRVQIKDELGQAFVALVRGRGRAGERDGVVAAMGKRLIWRGSFSML